jgi:hypothetical protein
MKLQQGKSYLFKYNDISVYSRIDDVNPIKHSVELEAFIPSVSAWFEGCGWVIVKLKYLENLKLDFLQEGH